MGLASFHSSSINACKGDTQVQRNAFHVPLELLCRNFPHYKDTHIRLRTCSSLDMTLYDQLTTSPQRCPRLSSGRSKRRDVFCRPNFSSLLRQPFCLKHVSTRMYGNSNSPGFGLKRAGMKSKVGRNVLQRKKALFAAAKGEPHPSFRSGKWSDAMLWQWDGGKPPTSARLPPLANPNRLPLRASLLLL